MAEQAHRDWTLFLAQRTRELAPGARLLVNMMGIPEVGTTAGHALWQDLRAICEDLAAEGLLDRTRLDDYVILVYERTLTEVRRPFSEDLGRQLELESLSLHEVPNPAAERYREDGDAGAFARDVTGFVRAWSEPSLREAFAASGAAMVALYQRLESRIRESAQSFVFDVHAVRAVIRRLD
jgi:gibberellin A4 carboxyl methyltransferase